MTHLPDFPCSPEHIRRRQDIRLRLLLCAEEMHLRYSGEIYLCGSGLAAETPDDWDIRVILDDKVFDAQGHQFWSMESALRTREQRRLNLLDFDVRILPFRLWYVNDALRLDEYAMPVVSISDAPIAAPVSELERNKDIIAKHKLNPEFHILIGSLMFMRGDKKTALQAFIRAVQLDPKCAGGWLNIGNIFYDAGDFRKAAVYYRRALQLKPDYAKAYINMANALVQLGVHASALPFYDKALALEPDLAATHHNKANALTYLKHFAEAEHELTTALELAPSDEKILNTLGNFYASQNNNYAAGAAYSLAICECPAYAPLYTNLANIYSNLGRWTESVRNYERGLVLDPHNPGVRYNLALAYLRHGNYRLGWKAYESRFKFHELSVKTRDFRQPLWKGEDIAGKRILIHAEQGMGDSFQFCRYLPMVASLGAEVYFEVQHGLQRILVTVPGIAKICTRGLGLPDFDVHCALLSLPAIFKTDIDTVPQNIPYVEPWAWEIEAIRRRFPQSGYRVGIHWQGNPKYKKDKERSFSLSEFAPIASVPGVVLISLQKGSGASQIDKYRELHVVDASSRAKDFAESAALIATLDLVITSDSAVFHLAGAMGKEVWLLLARLPDWRWGDTGDTTPWYPTARLFRQNISGDWAELMLRVKAALEARLEPIDDH